jgi:hypothetical protein
MCNHPRTFHLRCGHTGAGIPTICRYRYLIIHKITAHVTRADALCADCVTAVNKRNFEKEVKKEEESYDERVKRLWIKNELREAGRGGGDI